MRLDHEKREIENRRKDIERERSDVERIRAIGAEKERVLQERELNAEHGFRAQNEQALRALEERANELRGQITALEIETSAGRSTIDQELTQMRSQRMVELDQEADEMRTSRIAELEQQRIDSDREHAELVRIGEESRRQRRALEAERAVFDDDRAAMVQDVERRHAAKLEQLEAANDALTQRLNQARADRARAEKELATAEEATRVLDGRPLDVIAADLRALRADRDRLTQELAERPAADQAMELEELRRANAVVTTELADVRRERNELQIAKQRERGHLAEVEVLSDKARALESTISAYKTALDEQKQDFDELVEKQATRSPFERMSTMDEDPDLSEPPSRLERPANLADFVADLRQRMAADPLRPGQPLYFSLRDLRVFLAGMAMSRLHLLQGISGTGKTSLPLAFARALGGGSSLVEVQAGWRDRQDLVGHFNAFERRFYESEFLQALYRAQCPAYRDRPYIVVLDEMNLSHPEQYFADLLSALERDADLKLTLMTAPVEPAPERLERPDSHDPAERVVRRHREPRRDDQGLRGQDLRPRARPGAAYPSRGVHSRNVSPRAPVSFDALASLFDRASVRHKKDADLAVRTLKASSPTCSTIASMSVGAIASRNSSSASFRL